MAVHHDALYLRGMNKSVGIIMGSASDLPVMEGAQKILQELGVKCEMTVVSAHRTPDRMVTYAREAAGRGICLLYTSDAATKA